MTKKEKDATRSPMAQTFTNPLVAESPPPSSSNDDANVEVGAPAAGSEPEPEVAPNAGAATPPRPDRSGTQPLRLSRAEGEIWTILYEPRFEHFSGSPG